MTKKTRAKMRRALLTLSLVLVMMMAAVGGTIAWLQDETDEVVNTFSSTDLGIDLDEETEKDFDLIPGFTYEKKPIVTVEAESEAMWLFVKMTTSNGIENFIDYAAKPVVEDWATVEHNFEAAEGETITVYAKKIDANTAKAGTTIALLNAVESEVDEDGNETTYEVKVLEDLTKEDMEDVTSLTMEFQAYAVQLFKNADVEFTAQEAWDTLGVPAIAG